MWLILQIQMYLFHLFKIESEFFKIYSTDFSISLLEIGIKYAYFPFLKQSLNFQNINTLSNRLWYHTAIVEYKGS